jgi:hypothetical protein
LSRAPGLPFFFDRRARERSRWLSHKYARFKYEQLDFLFLSIARFCHINRPIGGYYFEFGCHEGNTIRKAWEHTQHLFDWTYIAFDSFEGLPEISPIDKQDIWEKGKLATSEERFLEIATAAGIPRDRLLTVRGFYDQSLSEQTRQRLEGRKAAVVYIDCDLYASTVPVLEFMRNFLQVGTVIVFDDWYCFHGDPERGEQRAWREFRARYPDLRFTEFVQTNEAKAFIHLGAA